MPRATLTVTIPEGVWIGDVSRAHPDASVRVLAAFADDDVGVGLVEVTAPDLPGVVADLEAESAVTELELLERFEETVLLQFETTTPLLLLPARDSGVPLTMPFTIEDGELEWEITAPQGRLSELGGRLEEFGIPFSVDEVGRHVDPERLLTGQQLRLAHAAFERGYYDTPRQCSLTDLADDVGLAKSTCSETLHRAEGKMVEQFFERLGETSVDPLKL